MPHDQTSTGNVYRFGPFTLDTATRQLVRDGIPLRAPPKVFDLVATLVTNRHRVLSRAELMRRVWPRSVVAKGALPQTMLKLRKLLGGEEASAQWIATVRGVGYRFVGDATVEGTAPTPGNAVSPAPATSSATVDATAHRVDVLRRQAWEHWIRLDDDRLRQTVACLRNREECGLDPRARVLALVYQSALDSRGDDLQAAWQALVEAERLADRVAAPEVRCDMLRMQAMFHVRYTSAGDAVPLLSEAAKLADSLPDPIDAADCAKLLALTFGRVGDTPSCEEWTERALASMRRTDRPWFRDHCLSALAGSWVQLGEAAARAGDPGRARLCWTRALQMLDEVESSGGIEGDAAGPADILVSINRAWAEGYLDAACRPAAIRTFRKLLASETRTGLRLSLLLGLSTFLCEEGLLDDARSQCDEALSLGNATGVMRQRANLLDVAAEIATRQGRHADAVRSLRHLLRWRDETARDEALRTARVTAMRLKTDRALAVAQAADQLARKAMADRDLALRQQALGSIEQRIDGAAGLLPPARFSAWMTSALARAVQQSRALPLIVVHASPRDGDWLQQAVGCLAAQLRSGDRWTVLSDGLIVVALDAVVDEHQPLAAARLGRQLASALVRDSANTPCPGVQVLVVDVSDQADIDAAWRRLRAAAEL